MRTFRIEMDTAMEHSFCNYHAKGLHYLCLKRSDDLTEKLYFIDHDASDRHVVVPHDHRYDFTSETLVGECQNILFEEDPRGGDWFKFRYDTPLNGGKGFLSDGRTKLIARSAHPFVRGQWFKEAAEEVHTLRCAEGTILFQRQYADRVTEPTVAYSSSSALPNTSGLYDLPTEDFIFDCARKLISAGYAVEVMPQ